MNREGQYATCERCKLLRFCLIVAGVALLMYESLFLGEHDSRRGKA